ncbi:MAG: hypothetical protein ABI382_06095 [Nakamurella sp.]
MAPDPEQLLQQALRAQVGGPKRALAGTDRDGSIPAESAEGSRRFERFSTAQFLLLAAMVGLVIGMAAGFAVLLIR